ncbi:DUF417 family protein [Pseudoxanthomonas dokdonensis]|uniref:DUF417 family protein n=1 Tax=Pseudoxanthomonas dokdonensis TaxID=344882 RepID=UPI00070B2F81|nr:DUF417 family protein [Pseudoxanthomonas dokdonensis]
MRRIAAFLATQKATDNLARLLFAGVFLLFGIGKFHVDDALELAGVVAPHPMLNIALEALGPVGFANSLGVVEIIIGLLLLAGIGSARAGFIAALLAAGTFVVTCSLILFVEVFRDNGGFPFGNFTGLFLFKDLGLLACALLLLRIDARRLVGNHG